MQRAAVRRFISCNPFSGQVLKEYEFESDEQIQRKLQTANAAFQQFRQKDFAYRSTLLRALGQSLERHLDELARTTSVEMGKPITQSIADVKKSINHCNYFAENLASFLAPKNVQTEARKSCVFFDPLGVIYLMVPFNFPVWLVFKAGVSMIAAGNTIVCRNSDSTPQTGELIERVFRDAGFDEGYFQNVYTRPQQLDLICQNDAVQGVSFTGSTAAGSQIAQVASKYVKKSIMELGGSDPAIILKDADLDLAAQTTVKSRLLNCGQVCISLKRIIVEEAVYDDFLKKATEQFKSYKIGDPLDASTQVGPLAREDLLQNVRDQVQRGVQQGAKLVYQHDEWKGQAGGYYFSPAIFEVDAQNPLAQEEVFGPVFTVLKAQNEDHAIQLANQTRYGLGAAIFTRDLERAERLAHRVDSGAVFVNELVKSDSRLPSGGCKQSGFGRECGEFGIREFVNIKTFWFN